MSLAVLGHTCLYTLGLCSFCAVLSASAVLSRILMCVSTLLFPLLYPFFVDQTIETLNATVEEMLFGDDPEPFTDVTVGFC